MDNERHKKYIEILKERRPPRLKSIDRSISMAVENYNPQTPKQIDLPYRVDPINHLILPNVEIISPDEAENPKYSPNIHMKITSSSSAGAGTSSSSSHVRTPLRRSDTINIAYRQHHQQQPTISSITDTIKIDDRYHSRRGSSIRVGPSTLCPPERLSTSRSPSPNRRRYKNHRSFNEPTKHHHQTKPTFSLEDTKHHSLNDDLYPNSNLKYQNQPYISQERFQKESSPIPLDKSKMHLKLEGSVPLTVTEGVVRWKNLKRQNAYLKSREDITNTHPHQHQHQHQHQQQQDIFLSPNSLKDIQIHGGSLRSPRKSHSSSMKIKSYRENLIASKKSKSFIIDPALEYEIPIVHSQQQQQQQQQRNDHTNLHRNPQHIFVNDEIQKSPRPSYGHVHDDSISSYKNSSPYNSGDIDFAAIALKPFQHARRKSSVALAKGLKSETLSRENSSENHNGDRKRKKITCIIMTVFLCLACASIFVVLITLSHSSSTQQQQNQSKKIYTFSREMPIHYTVRQENERLMQESLNRAMLAKNYTESNF